MNWARVSSGVTGDILKDAGRGLIAAAFKPLKAQLARRGAELKSLTDYDGFDDLLNEALDVLAGSSGDRVGETVVMLKAFLSERPSAFDHERYRLWIGDARSRKLVKRAVHADAIGEDLTPILLQLREVFADVTLERPEAADRYAADALSFVFSSLYRYLTESEQVVLGILGTKVDAVAAEVRALAPKVNEALDERFGRLEAALIGREQPEAIDRDLSRRLSVAERRAGFSEASQANPFAVLGREAMQAETATGALRRRVLLRATCASAIRGDLVEAEAFFAAAQAVSGPADDTPAKARLLEAHGDVDEAIRLLRDRQDPDSRSTLMDIQRRAEGDEWVIEREELGVLLPDRLTPSGLIDLAQVLTRAGRPERVEALLAGAAEGQLDGCPFLLLLRAFNQLALTLPGPDRHLVKDGLPLIIAQLRPAAADDELRQRLDRGLEDLTKLVAHLVDLDLSATRTQVREIIRFFKLMHPERQAEALSELRTLLDQPGQALGRLSFAFAFLPGFDPAPIAHYLATREGLGGLDDNELQAAFVIALHSDERRSLGDFIAKHRVRLERAIGTAQVASLEVQALAAAGDPASARLVFNLHVEEFEGTLKSLLLTQIAKAEGDDPVTADKRFYEETRSLTALRSLVGVLASRRDSAALAHYGRLLYEETGSLEDALVAARAMAMAERADAFSDFVERNPQIIEHDPELKRYRAWRLLFDGRIKEARRLAVDLRDAGGEHRDLDLEVTVAVDSGDWDSLAVPLASFLDTRERQSGLGLIRAAGIARVMDLPVSAPLMEAAVERAPQDATVLLTAYMLATELGEDQERRPETNEWFRRALELSGPEGPVQRFTIKELLAKERDWRRHVRDVNNRMLRGELALSLAAPALRTTITHVILRHLIRNPELPDPRGRVPIPLFAGHRLPAPIGEHRRIALDVTAVLVLGRLGLLAKVIEAYPCPTFAAGIMRQLFEERQRVRYHQRSRVERARHLRGAIAARQLTVVPRSLTPADSLASELGEELANLLSAAEANDGVVLRPAPVHAIGSVGEREADMTTHQGRLADMHALLRVLARLGRLNEQAEETARRYFDVQDAGWPNAAEPNTKRPLFLDGLALEYLQTLDLLDEVLRAFSSVYIHAEVEEQTIELLAYDEQGDEAVRVIDNVRRTVYAAFERDAMRFGPRRPGADDDDERSEYPILHLLSDLASADILIVDDRALAGKDVATDADGRQAAVATTLDVLEDLRSRELITQAEWRHHRFALRRSGAMLVPLEADEVVAGATRSGQAESAELRALRESLALARLAEVPRFPGEIPWFISVCTSITRSIQRTFPELPRDQAKGVTTYLHRLLPDPDDWLNFWHGGAGPEWAENVDRVLHQDIVTALHIDDKSARSAYLAWVEAHVLGPMRTLAPERYRALVDGVRKFLLENPTNDIDED